MISFARKLLARSFVRFLIVGSFNTLLSYFVYLAFLFAGLPFWLANLLALIFGILWSYMTMGRLVFASRTSGRLFHFAAAWALIYGLQTGCIALLMRAGVPPSWGGLILLPATSLASYLIQKVVVFGPRSGTTGIGPADLPAAER